MQFLEKLDLAILDGFFQKIADWINDRFSVSNFTLACLGYGTVFVGISYFGYKDYLKNGSSYVFYAIPIMALWTGFSLYKMDEEQKRMERQSPEATSYNRLRSFDRGGLFRLSLFFIACIHLVFHTIILIMVLYGDHASIAGVLVILANQAFVIAVGSVEYFAACTPKPPKAKVYRVPPAQMQADPTGA